MTVITWWIILCDFALFDASQQGGALQPSSARAIDATTTIDNHGVRRDGTNYFRLRKHDDGLSGIAIYPERLWDATTRACMIKKPTRMVEHAFASSMGTYAEAKAVCEAYKGGRLARSDEIMRHLSI